VRDAVVGKVCNADVAAAEVVPTAPLEPAAPEPAPLEAAALDAGPPGIMEETALVAAPLEAAALEAAPPGIIEEITLVAAPLVAGAAGPPGIMEDTADPLGAPTAPLEAKEVAGALLSGLYILSVEINNLGDEKTYNEEAGRVWVRVHGQLVIVKVVA
jgi:hypothetical protein